MKREIKNQIKEGKRFELAGVEYGPKRQTFKGCNGKFEYDPKTKTALSYGHHRIVAPVKGKLVFNSYPYSHTTSTHLWAARRLLETLGEKITLSFDFGGMNIETSFETQALGKMYYKLFDLKLKGARSRDKQGYASAIKSLEGQIKIAKSLGAKITTAELASVEANAIEDDKYQLERKRARSRERAAVEKAKRIALSNPIEADLSFLSEGE